MTDDIDIQNTQAYTYDISKSRAIINDILQIWLPGILCEEAQHLVYHGFFSQRYHTNLFTKQRRMYSDLQQIFGMLKYRNEKEKLQSYMPKSIRNSKGKEERIDMCKALEDLYHDGLEKGKKEGIKEGIKEGERSGMKALVETCRDLGVPKETAVSQLIVRFAMEKEDAWESVNRYW